MSRQAQSYILEFLMDAFLIQFLHVLYCFSVASYAMCMDGTQNIRGDDDTEYTRGNFDWAPVYPYFDPDVAQPTAAHYPYPSAPLGGSMIAEEDGGLQMKPCSQGSPEKPSAPEEKT